MSRMYIFAGTLVAIAMVGLGVSSTAFAASPETEKPHVIDVALGEGGVLLGQVVNTQGVSEANTPVKLFDGEKELAVSKTDDNGYFAFRGLRGGMYQLSAAEGTGVYRLWAPRTAPPSANKGALLVAGEDLARGQTGARIRSWLSNPWVVAGIVATAVAVPVAIHNDDDDDEPVSP